MGGENGTGDLAVRELLRATRDKVFFGGGGMIAHVLKGSG